MAGPLGKHDRLRGRRPGPYVLWTLALTLLFAGAFAVTAAVTANSTRSEPSPAPGECFGAAARAVGDACQQGLLDLSANPTPAQALDRPNSPCRMFRREAPVTCAFGVPRGREIARIALIGDSHAMHWRAALAPIAQRRGWLGFSLTRAGCPFSLAEPVLPRRLLPACVQWRRDVIRWLRGRPDVHTIFVSQHRVGVRVPRGSGRLDAEIAGYRRAWDALPRSVRRIVVIRDTPVNPGTTSGCVDTALLQGQPPATVCAFSRRTGLGADPAYVAARRIGPPRLGTVDMTKFFCDRSECYPVVGGALVFKNVGHMTAEYGATLAPYLDRRLETVLGELARARAAASS